MGERVETPKEGTRETWEAGTFSECFPGTRCWRKSVGGHSNSHIEKFALDLIFIAQKLVLNWAQLIAFPLECTGYICTL